MSSSGAPQTFQIFYFALAASHAGINSEALPAPLPLSKLYDTLEDRHPGIREAVLGTCMVTVNLEYIDLEEEMEIKAGDEVAIIPPVSSG